MARIIYAVAGEGFGHASRAHLIGQRFIDAGHEVMFVSSHRGLAYLRQYYGDRVKEIFGLLFDYSKGYVDPLATVWKNLSQIGPAFRLNHRLFEGVYQPFQPDLVVTDFEPFSAWWAWRNHVPFLSIDNEHVLIMCKLEHRLRDIVHRLNATVVVRCHYIGARAYVVTNFFTAPLKTKAAVLAPPIVRPAIARLQPSDAGHITIYATTGTHEDQWRDVLGRFPQQQFYVYGFNKNAEWKNCRFKEASMEGFATDLASARGVIASAGFSLISECLYLKKKMLLLPLPGQYEQLINARYVEELQLGVWARRVDETAVSCFLDRLAEPMPADERILWPDNKKFLATLQGVLSRLNLPVSLAL